MKNFIIILIVMVVIIAVGAYIWSLSSSSGVVVTPPDQNVATTSNNGVNQPPVNASTTQSENAVASEGSEVVIGKSVEGHDIVAYNYNYPQNAKVLFVGGIHGGYEWNTTLVAYQLMDYLKANPALIPANVEVTVIPTLNPDGLNKVVGKEGRFTVADVPTSSATQIAGRFNANQADLNRNFDCDWQASGKWQDTTVSGGSAAFSEPESQAFRDYVTAHQPSAVVVWYSAAGGVFASSCHNGVLPETSALTDLYAAASGYPAHESFDFYTITGDMVNWLAKQNIPAISVLLTNHTDTEWTKNLAGIKALLKHYVK